MPIALLIYADPSSILLTLLKHPAERLSGREMEVHPITISSPSLSASVLHSAGCSSSPVQSYSPVELLDSAGIGSQLLSSLPSCQLTMRTPPMSVAKTSPESRWN